ncbi:MAG: hypothetical protein R3F11_29185 [Verrucomicrobiales bacterium]
MAQAIHHPGIDAEGERARLVEARHAVADPVEAADAVEEIVVGDAHPGVEIRHRIGRRAEVLAEEQRIVAPLVVVEDGVAVVVPVAKPAGDVELLLDLAGVAPVHIVFVAALLFAEKAGWHMLDRIEPEAVAL